MAQQFTTTDVLRLEIETAATGLVNLVQNPSGELGGWGWSTPVANTTLSGSASGTPTMTFETTVAQACHVITEPMALAANQYVAARFRQSGGPANVGFKARFEFYNASLTLVSSSTQTAQSSSFGDGILVVPAVQAPANTAYVGLRLDLYRSGGTPSANDYVVFNEVTVCKAATSGALQTTRTNLVTNPSFETNTTGWPWAFNVSSKTRVTSQAFVGSASMQVTASASGSMWVSTDAGASGIPVTGSTTYTASFYSTAGSTGRQIALGLDFYDSSGDPISGTSSGGVSDSTSGWTRKTITATSPPNAAYLKVTVSWIACAASEVHYLDGVMVEKAGAVGAYFDGSTLAAGKTYAWTGTAHNSSSTEATSTLAFIEPVPYLNVLGPTHDIRVTREALNVGSLTATILDSTIDPSQADLIRPGKRVRLLANTGTSWEPLFAGKADKASVVYELLADQESKRARITLSAVDPVSPLAGTSRTEGVGAIDDLPYVLEGCGVPWNVNGSGNQVPTATVVSVNENASALDQVAVTRDTALGYAWVDRYGVLQAWDPDLISGTVVTTLDEATYNPDLAIDYNTEACINEVRLKFLRLNPSTGESEEIPYGPYRNQSSIDTWGVRWAEFTIQGITEDASTLQAYADAILTANATPVVRINSVVLPITDTADLAPSRALLDLYDLVTVSNDRAGLTENSRVTGIEHTITPDKWLAKIGFSVDGSVASPQFTPSPTPGASGKTIGQLLRPVGEVSMFYGAKADCPAGWLVLDGTTFSSATYPDLATLLGGTTLPDFTDRFPIGAGTKALGTTGGNPTKSVPPHTHPAGTLANASVDHSGGTVQPGTGTAVNRVGLLNGSNNGSHTHTISGSTGAASGASFDVMNPWRALWFIIRAA